MDNVPLTWWLWFHLALVVMLALDLGVFHRKAHAVTFREALTWSAVWIGLALAFNGWIYSSLGSEPGLLFLTGYLVEKSLSVDNIFVFLLIFSYFKVPAIYQHRVLFWGVLTAILLRGVLIFAGIELLERVHWVIYLFGALLIYTGWKMLQHNEDSDPTDNPVYRWFTRRFPLHDSFADGRFLVRVDGRVVGTRLLSVLVLVEISDVVFAVDSIPAILAITTDSFLVYTSNVMAILGLRSLYFALSGSLGMFSNLKYGLAFVLAFVGFKMVLSDLYHVPPAVSLGVIAAALTVSVLTSLGKRQS